MARLPAMNHPPAGTDPITGHASSTPEGFASLLASLDPPMAVVTTASGGEQAGCLIGFHSQCSIHPGRVAIWLSKANHTYRVALLAERFAVHFLAETDLAVAERFGTRSGDDVDKFAGTVWAPWAGDAEGDGAGRGDPVPVLAGCPNRLLARRRSVLDDGSDHVGFILDPLEAHTTGPFRPLRYSMAQHLEAGHPVDDRPTPPTERDR
jgi:flavin reductase (DIM6/NTAB) family NADH-FMN oxidoreductase RutF